MSGIHLARGAAIGVVETIPGVSGGTMALVVGIYERLIAQGAHLVADRCGGLMHYLPSLRRAYPKRPPRHRLDCGWPDQPQGIAFPA